MTAPTTASRTRFAVRFVDLDDERRGRIAPDTDQLVAEACRAKPGAWAELPTAGRTNLNGLVSNINVKGTRAFPKGEFRASQRDGVVYVKFIDAE